MTTVVITVRSGKRCTQRLCGTRLFFDKVDRDWETAWTKNVTPWETGQESAPLRHALSNDAILQQSDFLRRPDSHALVPGCGSGYDSILLGSASDDKGTPYFANVVGLDLSETAVGVCNANLELHRTSAGTASLTGNVSFTAGSFFDYQYSGSSAVNVLKSEVVKFDFIFDYLFFAALDYHSEQSTWAVDGGPPLRTRWGLSMQRLLKPRAGLLATLIFPTVHTGGPGGAAPLPDANANVNAGPPYPVTLESYRAVLEPLGFECAAQYNVQTSIKPRQGREVMAYWRLR
jgi:hypothetical protein